MGNENRPKWTLEQSKAIDTRNCNLLVAAAAGSGKTAVLVERIIKMITDPEASVDIDKLLIVTFTNAAASEMRERIGNAISKALHENPTSTVLQKQLTLLNKASITTIHSFCLEVIRNNFHRLDLDPSFRIGDETETLLLKQEIMEELFEEQYLKGEEGFYFLQLIESYANNKEDRPLQEMLLQLYDFVMSTPYPKKWLLEKVEAFRLEEGKDLESLPWVQSFLKDIAIELGGIEKVMLRAFTMVQETKGLEPYIPNFTEEISAIQDLGKACKHSLKALCEAFEALQFGKLKACKGCEEKEIQKKVQDLRNKVKKQLGTLGEQVQLLPSPHTLKDLEELYPLMKTLAELVIAFEEKYQAKKKERSIIDFHDFEHFALKVLLEWDEEGNMKVDEEGKPLPSEVAVALREKYTEILIDEYQDSNLVQEVLLNIISREALGSPNVFMVGDVKQSIYRFRQAKPELFLEKYHTYEEEEERPKRKITLYKNFRSRKEVVEAVNYLFEQIMSEEVGELDYNEREALNLGANFAALEEEGEIGGPVEIHLLEKNIEEDFSLEEEEEETVEEEAPSDIQMEARLVARRIKELMEPKEGVPFKVLDKYTHTYRRVQYKDMVILLRATSNWAPVFMEELKLEGIPVYADTGTGYFDTLEIQVMLSLLQIIDNPRQDVPLLAVLRSPIGGFSPEELTDIRLSTKEGTFYEAMEKALAKEDIPSSLKEKSESFLARLNTFRERAHHVPIDEFIWYLYTETGYYGYVGAIPGGAQRQANLRILFQRARQYEETSYKGLFHFIHFIQRLKTSSGDMGSAKIVGENEDVVRIMSIHKSKGLEFPVVFVSAMGKQFNLMDLNKTILFHHELGFGPEYVDCVRRIAYPTILKEVIKKKIKVESLSEEMRVLYVALTRAKEKLILTGAVKNIEKQAEKWAMSLQEKEPKLGTYEILKGKHYFDWILPTVIRHEGGAVLRQVAGITDCREDCLRKGKASFTLKLWNRQDFLSVEEQEEAAQKDLETFLETLLQEEGELSLEEKIQARLNFVYPYRRAAELPTMLTVTELKRKINASLDTEYAHNLFIPPLRKRPKFLEEKKGLTPAEKGTAMHAVMQRLCLTKAQSKEGIQKQIEEMVDKNLLTKEQGDAVSHKKILTFLSTTLGQRMQKAEERNCLYREIPFHISIRSTEVYKDLPEDLFKEEKIMVQGIIDSYFEEEGQIILVDYKTDYVPEGQEQLIIDKYKIQIEYYARALEKSLSMKVKEKYLYSFSLGKEIRI